MNMCQETNMNVFIYLNQASIVEMYELMHEHALSMTTAFDKDQDEMF